MSCFLEACGVTQKENGVDLIDAIPFPVFTLVYLIFVDRTKISKTCAQSTIGYLGDRLGLMRIQITQYSGAERSTFQES